MHGTEYTENQQPQNTYVVHNKTDKNIKNKSFFSHIMMFRNCGTRTAVVLNGSVNLLLNGSVNLLLNGGVNLLLNGCSFIAERSVNLLLNESVNLLLNGSVNLLLNGVLICC